MHRADLCVRGGFSSFDAPSTLLTGARVHIHETYLGYVFAMQLDLGGAVYYEATNRKTETFLLCGPAYHDVCNGPLQNWHLNSRLLNETFRMQGMTRAGGLL